MSAGDRTFQQMQLQKAMTRVQKSLHQLKVEAMRWREIIGMVYEQELPQRSIHTPMRHTHPG